MSCIIVPFIMDRCASLFKILKKPTIRMVLNVVLLILVGIPVLAYALLASPNGRGFYCSDESLSYPLLPSTIPTSTLIFGGLFIPFVVILIVESFKDPLDNNAEENWRYPKVITFARAILHFLFGCGCIQTITDITKYNIGRLRPHFHAACDTDWDSIKDNCSTAIQTHPLYIYPAPCRNMDEHQVRDAQLSFFSGHASFSAFTMFYLIIYLENRFTWRHPTLLKPFIQFICLVLTVYTSISRVFDYHHHWSDVLFGFILGGIMAYLIARFVSGLVKGNTRHEQNLDKGETA